MCFMWQNMSWERHITHSLDTLTCPTKNSGSFSLFIPQSHSSLFCLQVAVTIFFLSANQCSVKLRTQRTPLTQFWSVLVSFYSYFRGQGLRNCVLKYPWMHASKRVTRGGVHGTEKGKPEGETFVTGEVMEILLFLNLCLNAVWSSFHIILHLHF